MMEYYEIKAEQEKARRLTVAPAKPTEYITIPMAEYVYLQRVDALMDALMADPSRYNSQVVLAVLEAAKAMRDGRVVGAE